MAQAFRNTIIHAPSDLQYSLRSHLHRGQLLQLLALRMLVVAVYEGEEHLVCPDVMVTVGVGVVIECLIAEVHVEGVVVVGLLHLLASGFEDVLRHTGVTVVVGVQAEGLCDELWCELRDFLAEVGLVEAVHLLGGEVAEGKVLVQVNAVEAHGIAQVESQYFQGDVEDGVPLPMLCDEGDGEELREHLVVHGSWNWVVGHLDALSCHAFQALCQARVVGLVGLQFAEADFHMAHLLAVLVGTEYDLAIFLLGGDGFRDVFLAVLEDTHQDGALIAVVGVEGERLYSKL